MPYGSGPRGNILRACGVGRWREILIEVRRQHVCSTDQQRANSTHLPEAQQGFMGLGAFGLVREERESSGDSVQGLGFYGNPLALSHLDNCH